MADATNNYETLDRALKKIGIILVDDSGFLRNGKSIACVDLLRKLLLSTSVPTAKLLLQRGCPSHAPDRKLVAAAFDLVRDKIKFLPSLTVDQFFKEGYAAHKLAILVKLTTYIAETDRAFAKAQPPKMMYVVPSEASHTNSSFKYESETEHEHEEQQESSLLDEVSVNESYSDLPPAPASNHRPTSSTTHSAHAAHMHAEPPRAWPQTDFIKKHILDNNKLQSMNNSPARITAPKSRSTTPTSTRKSGNSSSSMYGVDVYDIEEKTAALEAIQALRAARSGITTHNTHHNTNSNTNNSANTNHSTNHNNTNNSTNSLNGHYHSPQKYTTFSAESSPVFKNNNTLTELAAADVPYTNTNNTNNTSTYNTNANTSSAEHTHSGANSADFQQFVQYTVDQAVAAKIEYDPVVQKLIDQRVEAIVEQRVSAAVQELTTKYDFIINKLVAAVDAEFTLLNNKLAMQQQNIQDQY